MIDISRQIRKDASAAGTGLKCLSARFVIDIRLAPSSIVSAYTSLKCLSARFVIDISTTKSFTEPSLQRLKCLSARFVIDISSIEVVNPTPTGMSQMPFG